MTSRHIAFGLCAALLLFSVGAGARGSDRRLTPLVRAVQQAKEAVVNIHSEKTSTDDPLFANGKPRKVNGMGTGIVIDERGYIVTNYHVVAGVDSLRVSLHDGSNYEAQVISYDREHDLAIIKVTATRPLSLMSLGTSSDLMLGETVFAVGNAFGYEHTVTSGIVSALSRDVEVNEKQSYKNLIQTDASINPGNSGGPLLNLDGEVVAINVAIRAGAQRIGFAIPIDDARRVIARLLSVEQLSSTWHGLKASDVKTGDKRLLQVDACEPESPAAAAGFKPGDVIVSVGPVPVVDAVDLERSLLERPVGEKVDVVVRRGDGTEKLTLELAQLTRPALPAVADVQVVRANNEETAVEKAWRLLGLRLEPLQGNELNLVRPKYRGGMRVTRVRPQSPAAANGITQGDFLVGLHVWETVNIANIEYVIDHPQRDSFNPLKFYILRREETLYGHMQLDSGK